MLIFWNWSLFQDVVYLDIDYMNNFKDFTFDGERYQNLPSFVDKLHDKGRKVVIALVSKYFT